MSKQPIPIMSADTSKFARLLAKQLTDHGASPSHLTLMNMLARAAGFRNYQHLKASHAADARLRESPAPKAIDFKVVERVITQFDDDGRLLRWPSRRPVQEICLWALWARVPVGRQLQEREVNALLNDAHLFGDAALLRRSMIGADLMRRNRDGSCYERVERQPPGEALAVIARVKEIGAVRG